LNDILSSKKETLVENKAGETEWNPKESLVGHRTSSCDVTKEYLKDNSIVELEAELKSIRGDKGKKNLFVRQR